MTADIEAIGKDIVDAGNSSAERIHQSRRKIKSGV